jgi:hypothetical protein
MTQDDPNSEFWRHARSTVFWMRVHIFLMIVVYEAALAAAIAVPVYFIFSPNAAWWAFFVAFGVLCNVFTTVARLLLPAAPIPGASRAPWPQPAIRKML